MASYLDLDVLAFQEASVKRGDGILGFLQTNTIEFTERHLLSDQIIDHVKKRGWDAQWRNELAIIRNPNEFTDPQVRNMDNKLGRFYHIEVCNRHREKTAKNCYVYLAKAAKLDPRTEITTKTVELKWAGYVWPNAHVLSKKTRQFDALWILHEQPTRVLFQLFTDATDFIPGIEGVGSYELEYVVVSDNFPPARCTVKLDLRSSHTLTTLT